MRDDIAPPCFGVGEHGARTQGCAADQTGIGALEHAAAVERQ
jgi:hypothetical protein